MKFDDASWHVNSVDVQTDEPYLFASGHIVAYLQWCFRKGWAGSIHLEDEMCNSALNDALNGEGSFSRFFEDCCDCKFTDEDLNDEGTVFTQWYYENQYFDDIMAICGDSVFSKKGEDYNLKELNKHLDTVYTNWSNSSSKPWWKFW